MQPKGSLEIRIEDIPAREEADDAPARSAGSVRPCLARRPTGQKRPKIRLLPAWSALPLPFGITRRVVANERPCLVLSRRSTKYDLALPWGLAWAGTRRWRQEEIYGGKARAFVFGRFAESGDLCVFVFARNAAAHADYRGGLGQCGAVWRLVFELSRLATTERSVGEWNVGRNGRDERALTVDYEALGFAYAGSRQA